MLHASDFSPLTVQLAIFVAGEGLAPRSVLSIALTDWADVYDAEPVSLALPADIPGEVPSVIASSSDEAMQLQVAREKVSVVWQLRNEPRQIEEILTMAAHQLGTVTSRLDVRIGRVGAVVRRIAEADQPGVQLARQFCRDEWIRGPLNRPEGFELHAHKVFALPSGLRVNSWVRIRTAIGNAPRYQFVSVEQDINTLAEEAGSRRFRADEVQQFVALVVPEFDSILQAYFPERVPEANERD